MCGPETDGPGEIRPLRTLPHRYDRAVEVGTLHHVAMAVEDLDAAVETYRLLFGAEVELRGTLEGQGVEAVYLQLGGGRVELMAALGEDTPVGRFLARRGPGMHHVAFEVEDLGATVRELAGKGANVIDAEPWPGLGGHLVSFIHPESVHGVLVEVVAHD
jgi:methylmalonyl-CoA/ethylmalonyl-CoA epimerase